MKLSKNDNYLTLNGSSICRLYTVLKIDLKSKFAVFNTALHAL